MFHLGFLALAAAASSAAAAVTSSAPVRADAPAPVIARGERVNGATVRVPARATDAAAAPLIDRGRLRNAIAACIDEAERAADGAGADAIDVSEIAQLESGWRVVGRIAVNRLGRAWQDGDRVYGRGWRGDFRGWTPALRGYDAVRFSCTYRSDAAPSIAFG